MRPKTEAALRDERWGLWVWVAWGLSVAVMVVLAVLVFALRDNDSHSAGATVTFLRPAAGGSLTALAWLLTAALGILACWRQIARDRARKQIWWAGGLCLMAYPTALLAAPQNLIFPACQWSAEYSLVGPDGKTYYVLHAPPPMNGSGHCALARRKSGSLLHFTVEIVTDFGWTRECFYGEEVLRAATRDPDAGVRKVASALVKSGARLHRLSPGS